MSMFGYHPDYPGPDSPGFKLEHLDLLSGEARSFAEELLEKFQHLADKVYLGRFGISARREPDRFEHFMNRIGITVGGSLYYEIMIDDHADNGLRVFTMEHDEYIDYQLILDNKQEPGQAYINEDSSRQAVLAFLDSLYNEQVIAFRTYSGSTELASGTLVVDQLGADPATWAGNNLPRPRQPRELRHVLRSWKGTYDREVTSFG